MLQDGAAICATNCPEGSLGGEAAPSSGAPAPTESSSDISNPTASPSDVPPPTPVDDCSTEVPTATADAANLGLETATEGCEDTWTTTATVPAATVIADLGFETDDITTSCDEATPSPEETVEPVLIIDPTETPCATETMRLYARDYIVPVITTTDAFGGYAVPTPDSSIEIQVADATSSDIPSEPTPSDTMTILAELPVEETATELAAEIALPTETPTSTDGAMKSGYAVPFAEVTVLPTDMPLPSEILEDLPSPEISVAPTDVLLPSEGLGALPQITDYYSSTAQSLAMPTAVSSDTDILPEAELPAATEDDSVTSDGVFSAEVPVVTSVSGESSIATETISSPTSIITSETIECEQINPIIAPDTICDVENSPVICSGSQIAQCNCKNK
jgi:hypothetical protein